MQGRSYQRSLMGSSLVVLLMGPSVWAVPAAEPEGRMDSAKSVSTLRWPKAGRRPLQPSTTVKDWLAQALAQITDLQINETVEGIELVLVATNADLAEVSTTRSRDSLIITINNAQLVENALQANPAEGMDEITLQSLDNNRVQLTIVTTAETAQVSTNPDGLTVLVNTVAEQPTDSAPAREPAASAEEDELEIVVTAEKTPENVQNVPLSLTVLTEKEIEDADITSFEDIADNTPNFSLFSGDGANSPFYSIRGLGNSNFLSRDAVAFYIDDVPYDRIGFITTDLPDIAQVEVLRGPQSTLYGRNSLSGVVNIKTRQPTNEVEVNGTASYGNFDAVNLRAGVSGPLVKDELFFRLSGNFLSRDGYINNTFLDNDVDEQRNLNGRAKLLWTPADEWEISFNASIEDLDSGTNLVAINDFNPANAFEIESDVNNSFKRNTNTQALKIAYTHPQFRATSITSRRFSKSQQRSDADGSPLNLIVNTNDFAATVWSQEIRFQSPEEAETLEWLVGGYFESSQFSNQNDGFTFGADAGAVGFPVGTNLRSGELDETILAAFGQVSYRPAPPLTLTAGLRFESFNSTLQNLDTVFTPPGGPSFTTFSARDVQQDTDILLPRLVAEYRFNPDLMIYGSVTRGYRPGGVNFRGDATTLTFNAEKSWNYEIGLKSSWLDDRLKVNLALFHNDVNDYQVLVTDNLAVGRIDNAEVNITGGELELRATPMDGLDIIAGLGISDAKFTEFGNFDGNRVPFAPSFTYNVALQYRAPMGLFARIALQGLGTTNFTEDNTLKQNPYATVNLRLGYEFDQTGLYVFANNIFDTGYFAQGFDFAPIGFLVTPGAPATFGVQVTTRF